MKIFKPRVKKPKKEELPFKGVMTVTGRANSICPGRVSELVSIETRGADMVAISINWEKCAYSYVTMANVKMEEDKPLENWIKSWGNPK